MIDQAQNLRDKMKSIKKDSNIIYKKRPKIITISSGKGGVGKSNIVSNIAITLTNMDKKVLILDTDIGMSNIDVLLNINTKYNILDIINGTKRLDDVKVKSDYGVDIISGGSATNQIQEFSKEEIEKFINIIENILNYDYLLIDTGAGINKSMLSFISLSDEFILITTPEPTSITDGYSLLKIIKNYDIKDSINIIVNKSVNENEAINTYKKIKNVSDKFLGLDLKMIGYIPEDKRVSSAVKLQMPFCVLYPNTHLTKTLKNITLNILNNNQYKKDSNLIKRMFNVLNI